MKSLYLQENEISDLTPLENLTELENVGLKDNKVTDKDCEDLETKLPNGNVYND